MVQGRTGRIVQIKKGRTKTIEGTIRQATFAGDVSFTAPMALGDKLTLGVNVAFEPLPYKTGGKSRQRKVKITKILKG